MHVLVRSHLPSVPQVALQQLVILGLHRLFRVKFLIGGQAGDVINALRKAGLRCRKRRERRRRRGKKQQTDSAMAFI